MATPAPIVAQKYDWLRRGIRSFIQGFIGVLILVAVPVVTKWATDIGSGGAIVIDIPFWRSVGIAALGGGCVGVVSFAQNALEDKAGMPALLKGTASSGANPAPDPAKGP